MAVTDQQKIDFLLKKIGYTKTKTGSTVGTGAISGTGKQPFAEAIPSPLVVPNSSLWNEAGSIPATPPGSTNNQVRVYLAATSGHRMTVDSTSSGNRAFIAFSTYNDTSSVRLSNWIDTQFGAGYLIKVFKGDPNSGGVALSAAGSGSNDGWFFDYSAGVLNFNDTNVPSGVTSTNIYIVGYRYIGSTGAPTSGISTFSYLDLAVERNLDVGVQGGISTFRNNIDSKSSQNKIPFLYSNMSDLPAAGTYHGMFAHVHATGRGYFAHAGGWHELVNVETNGNVGTGTQRYLLGSLVSTSTTAVSLNVTGISTFGGNLDINADIDVDGHTNLDNLSVAGVSTFAGTVNTASIVATGIDLNGDIDVDGHTNLDNLSVAGVTTATGDLTLGNNLIIAYNKRIKLNGTNTEIFDDNNLRIDTNGSLIIRKKTGPEAMGLFIPDGAVQLYHDGDFKFETTGSGVNVSGTTTTTGLAVSGVSTFTGAIDANGDLDVDGHTNLDNVSISGVVTATTFVGNGDFVELDVDGHTNLDNVSIAGVTTTSGLLDINAGGQANTFKVEDLTDNRIVIAGTGGELEDSANLTFNGSILALTGSQTISSDLDVDGHTNLDNVSIAGVTTITGSSTSTLLIKASDNNGTPKLQLQDGLSRNNFIAVEGADNLVFAADEGNAGADSFMQFRVDGTERLRILNTGATVTGTLVATGADINGDLDVDGHTELDNVNITGVTTAVNVDINGDLDVDGHTNLDNVSIAGFTTITQDLDVDGHTNLDNLSVAGVSTLTGAVTASDIRSNTITLKNAAGNSTYAVFNNGGTSELRFNNSKKIETTNTGVTITGNNNVTGNLTAVDGVFSGNVSIGGTLTYEDVKNVDSVGLMTARAGINVTGGVITALAGQNKIPSLYNVMTDLPAAGSYHGMFAHVHATARGYFAHAGNWMELVNREVNGVVGTGTETYSIGNLVSTSSTATSLNVTGVTTVVTLDVNGDLDVDGHTNLDNVSVGGITTMTGNLHVANSQPSIYLNDLDSENDYSLMNNNGTFVIRDNDRGVNAYELLANGTNRFNGLVNIVNGLNIDTDLDVDGHTNLDNVSVAGVSTFSGNVNVNADILTVTADHPRIRLVDTNANDDFQISNYNGTFFITDQTDGHNRFSINSAGRVDVFGALYGGGRLEIAGNTDLNGDLDVDGHTNLDNVSIAGFTTITQDLDVDGHTNLDNVSIAGVSTFAGAIDLNADLDVSGTIKGYDYLVAPHGGTTTITVTVASKTSAHRYNGTGSGDGFVFDGFEAPFITLTPGRTYKFDQSDNSNSSHPIRFYLNADRSIDYTDGVTTNGTAGSSGAYTQIVVTDKTPTVLHYQCQNHSYMGNAAQLNTSAVVTTDDAQIYGNLCIKNSGISTFTGNVNISGVTATSGLLDINSGGQANTFKVEDLTQYRVVIAGSGGELEDSNNLRFDGSTLTVGGNIDLNGDIDVDGHTNLDNVNIVGVATVTGEINIPDKSGNSNWITFGDDEDFKLWHSGGSSHINNLTGDLYIQGAPGNNYVYIGPAGGGASLARFDMNGSGVRLYSGGNVKILTRADGVRTYGTLEAANLNVTGVTTAVTVDVNGDLDVDGHTNLDNVSVAGVTTFAGLVDINAGGQANTFKVEDLTSGRVVFAGTGGELEDSNNLRFDGSNLFVSGINVIGGGSIGLDIVTRNLKATGLSTFTGAIDANGDLDVDGHTNLDNLSVAGVSTFAGAAIFSNTVTHNSTTSLNDDVTFTGASYNALWDKSDNALEFNDNTKATFGTDVDLSIYHDSSNSYIVEGGTGSLYIKGSGIEIQDVGGSKYFTATSSVAKLFNNNNEKLATTGTGINITGLTDTDTLTTGNATFTGTITAGGSSGSNGQYLKSTGTGVAWANYPTARTTQSFTASAGQTSFSFSYNVGYLDVFVNGVKLSSSEFTATNGTSVVLSVGSFVGDIVELVSYNTIASGGGGGGLGNIVEDTTPQLGGNLDLFNKTINGTGNVNITGVITATNFVGDGSGLTGITASGSGVIVKNSGSTVGTAGTINFGDNLSVSPASAGIVTITAGIDTSQFNVNKLNVSGISTFNGNIDVNADIDVNGHTNLDNVSIAGVTTATGLIYANGGIQVENSSPSISLIDTNNNPDYIIGNSNGTFRVRNIQSAVDVFTILGTQVDFNGNVDCNSGIDVTGNATVSGDIDVDGHTELDNVNIAGVVTATTFKGALQGTSGTFSSNVDITGDLDVDGHTDLDNVSVAGVVTATTFVGALTGNASGSSGSCTGNAATATALQNARTIGGVSFDGTANINLPGVNASGNQDTSGTAAVATNVTVSANNTTNETVYPVFVDGATGSQGAETDTGLTYNPSTGNLTATKFTGDGSGLTGITASGSGIVIKHDGSTVGTAGTINFSTNLDVSAISAGIVTVTASGGGDVSSDSDENTVAGTNAGDSITSGTNNTHFGYDAGTTQTTSGNSAAFGHSALRLATGGANNAFGHKAGEQISTGFANCYFGYEAGSLTKSSSYNTGIGNGALKRAGNTQEGNLNSAVGYESLNSLQSGDFNTALGAYSGQQVTGSNNVCIGYQGGDVITSGSNNIVIGSGADASAATVSNEITLGNANITKLRVPGINVVLKDNGGTPTQGHVLTVDASGEAGFAAASSSPNVGITTNLSGTFTASAGSPSTINTFGYGSGDLVVEYTIYIKNGSDFQTQKLLAMRDGTTIHSTQFAVMFSSSLLVQCDATISSGNILLRATPETGVSGSTTYKVKREVM